MNQPFLDETLQHTSVFLRLGKAYNASIQEFETLTGIRAPAWRLLFLIHLQPGIGQKSLIRMIRVDPGSITRQLKELERQGLIVRAPDSLDARMARVKLSPKGSSQVKRIMAVRLEFLQRMLKDIPTQDIQTFIQVLDKICLNLGDDLQLPELGRQAR
ncbi:MAG: MarR family transcriptional regulator [Betaproteobacteria bacterium]|nr:MarR family transcriptional regulator [Betaproteobacteria bacterium]